MEDLSDCKTSPPGEESPKEEILSYIRNVAILHAKFWMLKNHKEILDRIAPSGCDKDYRPRYYSKLSNKKYLSNSSKLQKKINKVQNWERHSCMKIPKGYATPDWLSIKPTENGSYQVMSDPMVKEMLDAIVIRLPNYDQHELKLFNQKEPQTLIHGDLHQGNHLCGTGANEGKVIALDFQILGKGLVSVELIYLMDLMGLHKNYEEHEEFLREYHNSLVENGVTDYSFNDLSNDVEMALVEAMINLIDMCSGTTPEKLIKMFQGMAGEDKAERFAQLLELGLFNRCFVHLTNIYVKDKSKFLMV